jgi:ABC-type antimicrobial peptide transport system permease subunit
VSNARRGPRFVLLLYAGLVTLSGLIGVLFSLVVADPEPPRLFFLVALPPTTPGFAVYGALTVAVVLGVPLAGVVYVSRRLDPVEGRA